MENDIIEIRRHDINEQINIIIIFLFLNVKNYGEKILALEEADI